jgi:hypothetical protein
MSAYHSDDTRAEYRSRNNDMMSETSQDFVQKWGW